MNLLYDWMIIMAYVKTYKFKNEKTECSIRVNISTDTGEFSCKLPEFAKPYTYVERTTELGRKRLDVRRGDWCVVANTLFFSFTFINS